MDKSNDTVDQILINFRASSSLIQSLDQVCRFNKSTRTAVLITLIRSFLAHEIPKIERELKTRDRLDKTLVEKNLEPCRDAPPVFFSSTEFERELSDEVWEDF